MARGAVDWDSVEAWQRLVASIYASGVKINLKDTAKYYGTTYDTLENRLRKIKKDADSLKQEVDSGQRGEVVVSARVKSTPSTPSKAKGTTNKSGRLGAVAYGRVEKAKKTPTKAHVPFKHEHVELDSNKLDEPETMQSLMDFDFVGNPFGV